MLGIKAMLMWKRLKPREELCDAIPFRRKFAFQLLHHHVCLAERAESLALSRSHGLGIPGALKHYMVQNSFGERNRLNVYIVLRDMAINLV